MEEQSTRSENQTQRTRGEFARVRLAIAIPVLMLMLPLAIGVIYYQFLEESLSAVPLNDHAREAITVMMFRVYVWTFVVCAVALLFGVGLSWAISKPIHELIRATREVATGDLSHTVATDTGDEFGLLSSSFNQMIASLNRMIAERNKYILECYTGGLILTDSVGRIQAANTAAEQILGEPASALISRRVQDVLSQHENAQHLNSIIERALYQRQFADSREISIRLRGGQDFPLVVTTSPLRSMAGEQTGVVVNFRDLTQIKAFHRRLTRADRLAAIGTLAAGVAHEVRNPLGSIRGLAQMLCEEGPPDSETRRYAEVIVREADHVGQVVRELLEFAQPSHQETVLRSVNQLLRDAVEVAKWRVGDSRLSTVKVHERYGEVPALRLDAERMNRAFLNLIVNALEACGDGGQVAISSALESSASGDLDMVTVKIENTGESIPLENIERIFEPFFSTKPNGTGLGLPIAYQIITSHGGTLDVESNSGRSIFTVRLPATAGSTLGPGQV